MPQDITHYDVCMHLIIDSFKEDWMNVGKRAANSYPVVKEAWWCEFMAVREECLESHTFLAHWFTFTQQLQT